MSLKRLIYYSAIIGGWSAFVGWLVSELLLNRGEASGGWLIVALTCAIVGAAIGAGLNLVAGMVNGQWKQQIKRVVPGLIAGGVGGAIGGFLGDVLVGIFGVQFRALGWMIMGACIGVVEGLYERSPAKLRNGLIGGGIGGLIGGFLFQPIFNLLASSSAGMSSRATAFVILGMCIGILIGLVKVVFKSAWLTVLDGYRPGRQLILSDAQTVLGRAEYAALPFMARGDNEVELEHARIVRQPDGRFILEDNHSRHGTRINNVRIDGRTILNDGDVIRLGMNTIQFSERHHRSNEVMVTGPAAPLKPAAPVTAPPRPPIPTAVSASTVAPPRPPARAAAPVPKPVTTTTATKPAPPKPVPATTPAQPAPAAAATNDGSLVCPSCKKSMPKGQRYCIVCDMYF
jgi:pSer/pThr/pTyr-binding forkhead associated (FHA) protein